MKGVKGVLVGMIPQLQINTYKIIETAYVEKVYDDKAKNTTAITP